MLAWNESDVLTVLEVAPIVDDDNTCYEYLVTQDKSEINLKISPFDDEVEIELIDREHDFAPFSMQIHDCPSIERQVDLTGEYLELKAFNFVATVRDVENLPSGVRIYIHPTINVVMF